MNTKNTIRKILFVGMWLAIGSGMLILLIAAMGKQKRDNCKGYNIVITGEQNSGFFLDEESISKLLRTTANGNIKGQPKSSFNLQQMEETLEENVWIKDAQLYFDNRAMLHVSVMEREPVARIFTAGGRSFYLDESERRIPLSEKAIAKVPVFTGFPDKKVLAKPDSVLLRAIRTTAQFINTHSFWASQVAQIDMVPDCGPGCWEFEMTPVIGNHIVKLGDGEDIEKKFNRLLIFYQQVLSRTGFDKYKTIDVRFAGQVIGNKNGKSQLNNIQLPRQAEIVIPEVKPTKNIDQKPIAKKPGDKDTKKNDTKTDRPVETKTDKKQADPPSSEKSIKDGKEVPKAVMPKKQ